MHPPERATDKKTPNRLVNRLAGCGFAIGELTWKTCRDWPIGGLRQVSKTAFFWSRSWVLVPQKYIYKPPNIGPSSVVGSWFRTCLCESSRNERHLGLFEVLCVGRRGMGRMTRSAPGVADTEPAQAPTPSWRAFRTRAKRTATPYMVCWYVTSPGIVLSSPNKSSDFGVPHEVSSLDRTLGQL